MPRSLYFVLFSLFFSIYSLASNGSFEKVDAVVKNAIANDAIPGAVALILHKGEVVHFKAYGYSDVEKKVVMKKDHIFRIFSMTKQVTATAVLLLADEGKLSLADPVAKYIPEFANPQVLIPCGEGVEDCTGDYKLVPAKSDITVRQLLANTSGLTYSFLQNPFINDLYVKANISDGLVQTHATTAENIKRLAKQPLAFHPGEGYQYGMGADVAGYLVEVVSGMRFRDFCKERIFKPLDMPDTDFYLTQDKVSRLAKAYSLDQNGASIPMNAGTQHFYRFTYSHDFHHNGPQTYDSGGAGLVSTAADFGAFLKMLLNEGKWRGKPFLKKESWEQMTRSQTTGLPGTHFYPGYQFGLGAAVHADMTTSGRKSAPGEMRWSGLFYTHYQVDPTNDIASLIFMQLWPYGQKTVAEQFFDAVYASIKP